MGLWSGVKAGEALSSRFRATVLGPEPPGAPAAHGSGCPGGSYWHWEEVEGRGFVPYSGLYSSLAREKLQLVPGLGVYQRAGEYWHV